MTSDLAIKVALIVALGGTMSVLGADNPPRKTSVYALAKINDMTKNFNGEKYHLVWVFSKLGLLFLNRGETSTLMVFNGKLEGQFVSEVDKNDLPGVEKLPAGGLGVFWLKLPEKGNLEIVYGPVHSPKNYEDGAEIRQSIIKRGYVPFNIDVGKIPTIKAESAEELTRGMIPVFAAGRGTLESLVKLKGRSKVIGGVKHDLVAVMFNFDLLRLSSKDSPILTFFNGLPADEKLRADPKDEVEGEMNQNQQLWWLKLPEKGELEVSVAVVPSPKKEADELAKQVKELGYVPFKIAVDKIPVMEAKTAKELSEGLSRVWYGLPPEKEKK